MVVDDQAAGDLKEPSLKISLLVIGVKSIARSHPGLLVEVFRLAANTIDQHAHQDGLVARHQGANGIGVTCLVGLY
jgi:hypothetical protein